jgi:hypothetical protein
MKGAALSEAPVIETAIHREMLQGALRNSARSVVLQMVAVAYIAWIGWDAGNRGAAVAVLLIGLAVSGWRLELVRRHGNCADLDKQGVRASWRAMPRWRA